MSEEDRARAILMEVVAEPYNREVRGLWRRPRRRDGRPGSITEYILEEGLPFTPLTRLGKRVVLNPRCEKARNGGSHTFTPPHLGPTLRELLERAGHAVPDVVPANEAPGSRNSYREDCRSVPDVETEQHLAFVENL